MSDLLKLTKSGYLSIAIYSIGIGAACLIYYRVLRLQTLQSYSTPYSLILIIMISIMALNMAYSIVTPPDPEIQKSLRENDQVVQRTMNVIAFIFISNIMIREYNRSHTANSQIVQNLIVVITVTLMMNNVILWIPPQDVTTARALRDIRTVNFVMGLGFMILFIIDIVKRGNDTLSPHYVN